MIIWLWNDQMDNADIVQRKQNGKVRTAKGTNPRTGWHGKRISSSTGNFSFMF